MSPSCIQLESKLTPRAALVCGISNLSIVAGGAGAAVLQCGVSKPSIVAGGAGLDRIGSDRIGPDRIGSDRTGPDRIGSSRIGWDGIDGMIVIPWPFGFKKNVEHRCARTVADAGADQPCVADSGRHVFVSDGMGAGATQPSVRHALCIIGQVPTFHPEAVPDAGANQPSVAEGWRHVSVFDVLDAGAAQPSVPDAVCAIVSMHTHHPVAYASGGFFMSRAAGPRGGCRGRQPSPTSHAK